MPNETAVANRPTQNASPQSRGEVAVIKPARLPYPQGAEERFGVDRAAWRALTDAVFPAAKTADSIILALSYCRARKLDPFKRVIHIVPVWDSEQKRMVETVWPGIAELRTTAFRTGAYAGRDPAEYGPTITATVGSLSMSYPEWCQVTVYRMVQGQRVPFPGPRVYWLEAYAPAKRDDASPNAMWRRRPFGQLDKCAEAAALRAAFPEEIGGELIDDELRERHDHAPAENAPPRPTREQFASKPLPHPGITDAEVEEPEPDPPAADAQQPPADPPADAVAQGEAPDYRIAVEYVGTGKAATINGAKFQAALFAMLDENLGDAAAIREANEDTLDRLTREDRVRRAAIGDRFMAIAEGTYPAQGEAA